MLMQNFKSAADLKLTEAQKDALVKTLVLFETGKIQHRHNTERVDSIDKDPTFCGYFNMQHWQAAHPCGTVACIGGTAELIGGVDLESQNNEGLFRLFHPYSVLSKIASWDEITTIQAATALRSYLTTGDAHWDLAVSDLRI
jgi:hypothetical protein